MKTNNIRQFLLLGAVISAMGFTTNACANTVGVNAVLEAAAGKTTPGAPAPTASAPAKSAASAPKKIPASHASLPTKPVVLSAETTRSKVPLPEPSHAGKVPVHAVRGLPAPLSVQTASSTHPAMSIPNTVVTAAPQSNLHPKMIVTGQARMGMPQSAASVQSAGYVNPFLGAPSKEQNLSNELSLLKLKTQIAKEKATYVKYLNQGRSFQPQNSAEFHNLENAVVQMKSQLSTLAEEKRAAMVHIEAVRKKKMNALKLVAIIDNQGKRSALVQVGKQTRTVADGETVNGHLVKAIRAHALVLDNGRILRLARQIGHYESTQWKAQQQSGSIAAPQSSIAQRLAAEAQQSGIHLPQYGAPATSSGHPALPALNPAMFH